MIVATIEMFPLGMERARYKLGNIVITNDGTGDREIGAYDVILEAVERDGSLKEVKTCRVEDFARANGVFSLLSHALDCVRPGPWFPASRAPSDMPLLACWDANSATVMKVQKIDGGWHMLSHGNLVVATLSSAPSHVMYIPTIR